MKRIKVLIADDSALMRRLLTEIISKDPEFEVVGAVSDAYKAREQIKKLNPDVLTLDVEMPKMDGISFLEKLMRLRPMPVVMISAITQKGADVTMKALMLGAVDFVTKPKVDIENNLNEYADTIRSKLKAAATSGLSQRRWENCDHTLTPPRLQSRTNNGAGYGVIAVGASTGGVETIHALLARLPDNLPPIVIAQHIPPVFSASFAQRLNKQLNISVCEAQNDMLILPGHVYVAPGDQHLEIVRNGTDLRCQLNHGALVNRHKPSVDVLFNSVVNVLGANAVGVLLTGMGDDGARGLLALRDAGAETITQDRNSSIVWGMPRAATEIGAARYVLPLDKINGKLADLCAQKEK